jgi:hypothetical protein
MAGEASQLFGGLTVARVDGTIYNNATGEAPARASANSALTTAGQVAGAEASGSRRTEDAGREADGCLVSVCAPRRSFSTVCASRGCVANLIHLRR